ncbi:MAG: chromate efflux transporter [Planctomycetes bacterium]|nr:chromate efflux transporter [Planctomycetota bacterium]
MDLLTHLKELAGVFLKLGIIGFGGPAAHIAMMENEVVSKKKWMSREHFLDLIGATNLIPGPNSTEMAMHCGYHRAGWPGMIVAGMGFIIPATLITGAIAWFYQQYGSIPDIKPIWYGIRPSVLAIIINAVYKFGKKALKNWQLGIIGAAVMVGSLAGMSEVLILLAGGLLGMFWLSSSQKRDNVKASFFPSFLLSAKPGYPKAAIAATALYAGQVVSNVSLVKLFLVFLKIGSVLFGSGYVLIAYLQDELIDRLGWLTQQQLVDAIAVGQFTPGPVSSAVTFVGYQIIGIKGAILATVGMFLPSFFFVAMLNPFIPKMRNSRWVSCFLDSVNVGAVAIMAVAVIQLARVSLINWQTWLIALMSVAVTFIFKRVNTLWIVIGSSIVGYILTKI